METEYVADKYTKIQPKCLLGFHVFSIFSILFL